MGAPRQLNGSDIVGECDAAFSMCRASLSSERADDLVFVAYAGQPAVIHQ
jgi:hypothetical protein